MNLKCRNYSDLDGLRTFLTIVEEGSLTAAAASLYKTPSAVSYRIKALEDSLGVQLLERNTHSVKPTSAGEWLAEKARYLLDVHQSFYDELEIIRTGVEPTFTLVFNNLLYDDEAAANLLLHLNRKFPSTAFEIKKAVFTGVWDYMIHEGGSFAIGAPSFHSIDENYESTPLGLIEWTLVCGPTHPILKAENPTSAEVKRYPVVNIKDTSVHTDGRPAWRLEGQEEILVPNLITKIHCHAKGIGIGFLPKPIAQSWIAEGKLKELSIAGVTRQPSPMSYVRKKGDTGQVGNYLAYLIGQNHPLMAAFLQALTRQDAHGQAS